MPTAGIQFPQFLYPHWKSTLLWSFATLLYNLLLLKQQMPSYSAAFHLDQIYNDQLRCCDLFDFLCILIWEILNRIKDILAWMNSQCIKPVTCFPKHLHWQILQTNCNEAVDHRRYQIPYSSESYRILGIGRGFCGSFSPTSLLKRVWLNQVAQECFQAGLKVS